MIETPRVVQTAAQLTARIHLSIPRADIQSAMGPAIAEVMAAVAAQGVGPAGPWFTHHLKRPGAVFDFDACVPVSAPFAAVGRATPGEWPAMTVARTIYHGPYEGLAGAWEGFNAWVEADGLKRGPDLWERYLAGPESSADPADWRTELNWPLVG